MADSNRVNTGQHFRLCCALRLFVLSGLLGTEASPLLCGPVTFKFDAEIVGVPVGNPFDLPLTYQVGDIIQGTFAFEPGSGAPIGDNAIAAFQNHSLEFEINGIPSVRLVFVSRSSTTLLSTTLDFRNQSTC
jgi:hypothetical protein